MGTRLDYPSRLDYLKLSYSKIVCKHRVNMSLYDENMSLELSKNFFKLWVFMSSKKNFKEYQKFGQVSVVCEVGEF